MSKGFNELASDSDIENHAGIEIHKNIGFREVGRSIHFVKSLLISGLNGLRFSDYLR